MDYGYCVEYVSGYVGRAKVWDTTKPHWFTALDEAREACLQELDEDFAYYDQDDINVMYFAEIDPEDV